MATPLTEVQKCFNFYCTLKRYAYMSIMICIHSIISNICENKTNVANEIHAKAKHANIKDRRYSLSSQLKCLSERDAYFS